MKKTVAVLFMGSAISLLSACNTLANLQTQKTQLQNGNTVYTDINVTPTDNWGCKEVGAPQSYTWSKLQDEGQFKLTGASGLLKDNALAYANQQNLNINYINLTIPKQKTLSIGSSDSFILNDNAQAIATFYQCQQINPDHKLSAVKTSNIGFS